MPLILTSIMEYNDRHDNLLGCFNVLDCLELKVQHAANKMCSVNHFLQELLQGNFRFTVNNSIDLIEDARFSKEKINIDLKREDIVKEFQLSYQYIFSKLKNFSFEISKLMNLISVAYEICATVKPASSKMQFHSGELKAFEITQSKRPRTITNNEKHNYLISSFLSDQLPVYHSHIFYENVLKEGAFMNEKISLALVNSPFHFFEPKQGKFSSSFLSFTDKSCCKLKTDNHHRNISETNSLDAMMFHNSQFNFASCLIPLLFFDIDILFLKSNISQLLVNYFQNNTSGTTYPSFLDGNKALSIRNAVKLSLGSSHQVSFDSEKFLSFCSEEINETFLRKIVLFLIIENKRLKAKKSKLLASINFLCDIKQKLEEEVKRIEKKLAESSHKQRIEMLLKENEFRKRANFIYLKERTEFHQYLSTIIEERNQLLLEVKVLSARNQDMTAELTFFKDQYACFQSSKEKEVSELRSKLNLEIQKYENSLNLFKDQEINLGDMRKKIKDQEESLSCLENLINEIKIERDLEIKQQWQEMEEIHFVLITRDEECIVLNDDLKKCVADRDEEHKKNSILILEISDLKKMIKSMEDDLNLYRSDCRELRKKLIKAIKEKDILWKKTDHLTHLREAQVAGRWMGDHEVSSCLGCNTKFSFTLRKHHCRLCGKIFCHQCANNWLLTTASRRQIRVCSSCYIEHLQLKKAVKDGSNVNSISDSDDEGGGNSLCTWSAGMSSMNSDVSYPVGFGSIDRASNDLSLVSLDRDTTTCNRLYSKNKAKCHRDFDRNSNFDIITDEEIENSLSNSSPYNALLDEKMYLDTNVDLSVSLTLTRTTNEIKATGDAGISGTVWINAGMYCGIPILCDIAPTEIRWKFTCNAKTLTFSIIRKIEENSQDHLFNSNFLKKEDSIILTHTGLYTILFDNSFSRVKARKVQYTLWAEQK